MSDGHARLDTHRGVIALDRAIPARDYALTGHHYPHQGAGRHDRRR